MRSDKSDDGAAPGREPSPKSDKGKQPPMAKVAVRCTPAVEIKLRNWPPPGQSKKQAAELARKIAVDVEQRLLSLVTEASAAAGHTTLLSGPSCHMVGWDEVTVMENGAEVHYRIEHYACDDGSTYDLQVPI